MCIVHGVLRKLKDKRDICTANYFSITIIVGYQDACQGTHFDFEIKKFNSRLFQISGSCARSKFAHAFCVFSSEELTRALPSSVPLLCCSMPIIGIKFMIYYLTNRFHLVVLVYSDKLSSSMK